MAFVDHTPISPFSDMARRPRPFGARTNEVISEPNCTDDEVSPDIGDIRVIPSDLPDKSEMGLIDTSPISADGLVVKA